MWSQPRPGGELGLQRAQSSASVGEASYLRGPEDTGEDCAPIRFSLGACLCSHWGAGFLAFGVRNQHSTHTQVAGPFWRPGSPTLLVSLTPSQPELSPSYICLLSSERESKNPDSPFSALEKLVQLSFKRQYELSFPSRAVFCVCLTSCLRKDFWVRKQSCLFGPSVLDK